MSNKPRIRSSATTALCVVVSAVTLAACGSGGEDGVDPGSAADAPDFSAALDAAPPKLAALYDDSGKVLPGDDYDAEVAAVRGYPVVINLWASWCGPCRSELPHLQEAAAEHLDEVAFMGVDVSDTDDAAETYLRDHPMPYPSFADPGYDLAREIEPSVIGQPHTVFLDGEGDVVHVKYGPYASTEELDADIEEYALGGS
jgi:cytochrome c biogenesis protein CcmG/thiol:disulfide interchange protein DsbE